MDYFLNAVRRLIAKRGILHGIRSDQGMNIVGAKKVLQRAIEGMDKGAIQRSLCKEFKADWKQWKQNPPHKTGDTWEQQIQSVRLTCHFLNV